MISESHNWRDHTQVLAQTAHLSTWKWLHMDFRGAWKVYTSEICILTKKNPNSICFTIFKNYFSLQIYSCIFALGFFFSACFFHRLWLIFSYCFWKCHQIIKVHVSLIIFYSSIQVGILPLSWTRFNMSMSSEIASNLNFMNSLIKWHPKLLTIQPCQKENSLNSRKTCTESTSIYKASLWISFLTTWWKISRIYLNGNAHKQQIGKQKKCTNSAAL